MSVVFAGLYTSQHGVKLYKAFPSGDTWYILILLETFAGSSIITLFLTFLFQLSNPRCVELRLLPSNRWRRAAQDSLKALEAAKGISFKLSGDGNGWVSPLVSQPGWLPAVDGIDLAAQEKSWSWSRWMRPSYRQIWYGTFGATFVLIAFQCFCGVFVMMFASYVALTMVTLPWTRLGNRADVVRSPQANLSSGGAASKHLSLSLQQAPRANCHSKCFLFQSSHVAGQGAARPRWVCSLAVWIL